MPSQPTFTLKQRIRLWWITALGTLAIRVIGPTLRITMSAEEGGSVEPQHAIYAFWHQCVFGSAWLFRESGIAVMTSRSFDGEYIARIIQNLGYRAVRGSSSRGAVVALIGMKQELDEHHPVAFTIDGPRGPRFIAKPGPILLAKKTQRPIMCYHLALERKWMLRSWDQTMIPKPFSRGHLRVSSPMAVAADADDAATQRMQVEMQSALERVQAYAEQQAATQVDSPDQAD